jgi:Asp-tRNA(Asn)/Glu-tRNA(Gln) amidotransferase A subunit family amidase
MNTNEYQDHDAVGLAALIADRKVKPEEALDAAITSVENVNTEINAVVTTMYDEAKQTIQTGPPNGALHGVPMLLKDLRADYAGVPTTAGSRYFRDNVPDQDSETVARYKRAGLVIFGKTNTPEFGGNVSTEPVLHGPTTNPWDTSKIAGGSSGGSAAAVAARMVPAAHASDGGGSIRIPASCCGAVGLKPSRGRLSSGPTLGEAWNGLSVEHVISRSVRDSAAFLDASAGPDIGDPYTAPPPERAYLNEVGANPGTLRIAFSAEPKSGVPIHQDCIDALTNTVSLLEHLGHQVTEAQPDYDGGTLGGAIKLIIGANMMAGIVTHAKKTGREPAPDEIERVIRMRASLGDSVTGTEYALAIQEMHRVGRVVGHFMNDYDVFVTPTLAQPPLDIGSLRTDTQDVDTFLQRLYGFIPFTAVYNATGQPAVSLPLHWNEAGMPIGVQFAARFGDEATLFRLASQLEQAKPWHERKPALLGG